MDFDTIKNFSDIWGLVYLFAMFLIAVAFAFRPGSRERAKEAAQLPLKED